MKEFLIALGGILIAFGIAKLIVFFVQKRRENKNG